MSNDPPDTQRRPVDMNGVELKVGQEVLISPTRSVLIHWGLKTERMRYAGERAKITKFEWRSSGYWMVRLDRTFTHLNLYEKWPAECLTGMSLGLKGLVDRYRKEVHA